MTWPFGDLKTFGYSVIEADPPWSFDLYSEKGEEKSAQAHYACMDLDAIAALPVGHLARANAILLLWATIPMLPQALGVLRLWGASYKSHMVWRKVTANGRPRIGTGYRVRSMHEIVLLGTFGDGQQIHGAFPSVFDGVAREHSRKPDEFYELVKSKTIGLDRCSLFTRESRKGFDSWGNEATKFDEPTHLETAVACLGGE